MDKQLVISSINIICYNPSFYRNLRLISTISVQKALWYQGLEALRVRKIRGYIRNENLSPEVMNLEIS
jgi:hypothetical protein